MTNTSNSLSFNQDMALVQMFGKEEVFTSSLWKEKITNSKTLTSGKGENRAAKRKLYSPGSNSEDEDKKGTPKRRRESDAGELSPPGLSKPKTPTGPARLTVRLSERQQMALLMQMTADKTTQPSDAVTHYPLTPSSPHSAQKRTPSDRKVNKRNERGETPLHLAAIRGDVKATRKLIKSGVDVNITDYAGWTPLHEACNHGWIEIAKQLLKAGANVNAQGFDNDLPLHDAAINGHVKLVELLLRYGADPLRQNHMGKSPLDLAANKDIVRLMKGEVIASSNASSIADVRSPTSPESSNSDQDDLEQPGLAIDSSSELGLLAVRRSSPALPSMRHWNAVANHSTNQWSTTSDVSISCPGGGTALPINCVLSQSQADQHPQVLSPSRVQTSQAAHSPNTPSSTGFHSSAAGISKKVQVSHYMDRSSSSPRLTLKFRHIKQKDGGNRTGGTKNVSEDARMANSPSYGSYRVSVTAAERPLTFPADAEPADSRNPGRTAALSGTGVTGARTLWNGNASAGMRDGAENADRNRNGETSTTRTADARSDVADKSESFSNQFEDISDAEDDRPPSKPLDIGSAAKMFGLSQLSQHIPSVPAVYQCHPNSGAIFFDGNGPASIPLLSSLNWNNIAYGNYGGASGNQFPPPVAAADRPQGTKDSPVFPWARGQGVVSVRPLSSVQAMVPLSIDTSVVAHPQAPASCEKPFSGERASDLLISMPPSSAAATSKSGGKNETCFEDQKLFAKSELPNGGVQHSDRFGAAEKVDFDQKVPVGTSVDPLTVPAKMLPTDGIKNENLDDKSSVSNKTTSAEIIKTSEDSSEKRENSSEPKPLEIDAGADDDLASSKVVSSESDNSLRTDAEGRADGTGSTTNPNRTPFPCGQDLLLENSNLSGESFSSTLKVPPLKIIIPSKNGAVVHGDILSAKMASSAKSSLPYIVNILQNSVAAETTSAFDASDVDLLSSAKESSTCTSLPEPALMGNYDGLDSSCVDQKDSVMSRKRKFKSSCKALGKDKDRDLDETISNGDSKEFATGSKGSCSSKDSNDLKSDDKIETKEGKQSQNQSVATSGMERRMTRAAVRSQQQKGQQREKHASFSMDLGSAKTDGSSHHSGTEKENRESHSEAATTGKIGADASEDGNSYCPRKHKAKHRQLHQHHHQQQQQQQQQQQEPASVESHIPIAPLQTSFKKPTNPYGVYEEFKKKVAERKNRLSTVVPKLPASYSNFTLAQCRYSLHKDRTKQDELKLTSPSDLPEALKELFEDQEKKRHKLRMQHVKERERLVILAEQEMLRVQARAARATVGQCIPLSFSTLLCAEETHCRLDFDPDDKDQRSRYSGRQLKSWSEEIQEKFTKMKTELLSQHHLEADILRSVQKLDWEWKMKEVGSCDYHSTPAIDDLHVPRVNVSDDLDLPLGT